MTQAKFKDNEGKDWILSLNIGNVRQIKEVVGVDFGDLQGGAMVVIGNSPEKFGALLWLLCEKQADLSKITEEDFVSRLDGGAIERAGSAMEEAVVNFTPAPMRAAVSNAISAANKAQEAQAEVITEWVQGDDLQTKLKEQMREEIKRSGLS